MGLTLRPSLSKLLAKLIGRYSDRHLSSPAEAVLSSSNAAGASAFLLRFGRSRDERVVSELSVPRAGDAVTDDEQLLLYVQAGDRDALGILFDRYARLILSVGLKVLHDSGEAEDLVHDVFLFLLKKRTLFDPSRGSARAWLAKVTYHRALDRRKYLARRCFCDTSVDFSPDTAEAAKSSDLELFYWKSYLQRAFDDLSEDQRRTLALYFFEGLTINEISQRLGKPAVNVRNYYYRGLERLRELVARGELTR